jgi:hypothetical protein
MEILSITENHANISRLSMAYYNAQRSASYIRKLEDTTSELSQHLPDMGYTQASSLATASEGTQQTTIQWLNRIVSHGYCDVLAQLNQAFNFLAHSSKTHI